MNNRILVVGGGIAGVQSALDLAQMGIGVTVVEAAPSIGGRMAQLDKTFPTNDCSTCILSPKLIELSSHPLVEILSFSQVERLKREDGNFVATIREKARFVDPDKCTACGMCAEKCPVRIPDLFNRGIAETKCIHIPYAQAVPAVYRIEKEHCLYLSKGKCGVCSKVCQAGAVNYDDRDRVTERAFSVVILSSGTEEYTPRIRPEYGYHTYPNVITSIEYERFLSASGPTGGHILRPSDGKEPERIAFIQCVGSRDLQEGNNTYCSSFCCMQATKDAIITREHVTGADSTIFYIDLRTFGKGFDRYVERGKNEYGVRYIRSRVSEIQEDPETGNLNLSYLLSDGSTRESAEFDLVVLSVGIRTSPSTGHLLEEAGISRNETGFPLVSPSDRTSTNIEGLFTSGTITGPMDIPETVVSASAAAGAAAAYLHTIHRKDGNGSGSAADLSEVGGTESASTSAPGADTAPIPAPAAETEPASSPSLSAEIDVQGIPPRIGVVVCRCGTNIGSVVDVPGMTEKAKQLRNVVFAMDTTYACAKDSLSALTEEIRRSGANRIVVASCSPRTHESLFRSAIREAGLNKYLLQMTNIRDQCSWVHQKDPEAATGKAADLVSMAVSRARLLYPLAEKETTVEKSCLILGGGISGMTAALTVADSGHTVYLVEKDESLGGNARHMYSTRTIQSVPDYLTGLIEKVTSHSDIHVVTQTNVSRISGYVGNFSAVLDRDEGEDEEEIRAGAVIVATGADEHKTEAYGYGTETGVVTQRELDCMLAHDHPLLKLSDSLVMIQCVDSREGERNYCSRVCCSQAVHNARRVKRLSPETNVYILFRDIRTYGLSESTYCDARNEGIVFIRFPETRKPEVENDPQGNRVVHCYDDIMGSQITLAADLLVLSTGIDGPESNRHLSRMLKVPIDEDRFFLEAHVKLRPLDFATDGIFLCGLAHGPKTVEEAVSGAVAAAGRALTYLSKHVLSSEACTAEIIEQRCSACGRCVEVCPFSAIEIDEERETAVVNPLLCKGCGGCASTCFSGAIDVAGFTNRQIITEFETLFA